ncbi:hypothetical protein M3664_04525 [Paenibacillus lautus]|uniref:hypothetical protein n=1 Tax=Paenibacillus lautus TaxID=1401 RepID=UPI00204246A7|nr:hypothetical protein [Paenibacillus lautus]MCM3257046.1 hypothetical protein [Paenibacillus lautus]
MVAKSHWRGHEIEFLDGQWVFSDTKEPTQTTYDTRACGYCSMQATPEGHAACLGTLQGGMNACCGHGVREGAYVQFLDSSCVRGEDALTIMDILKKYKNI